MLVFGNVTPAPLQSLDWFEFGARVGYRMTQLATLDVFANGIAGDNGIQTKLHAGAGSVQTLTTDLGLAREVSAEIDRLLAGQREADDALGPTAGPPSA